MGGHQLENELISLSQRNCESLQVYLLNFKAFVLQLKHCGIEKKFEQLVFAILLNLGPRYSVFVSTIHASNSTTQTWNMPSLTYFMEPLNQE